MTTFADLTYGQQAQVADALSFIANAAQDGRRIDAIKRVREMSGLGLKEAKDIVDKLCPPPAFTTAPADADYIVTGERYGACENWGGFSTLDSARSFAADLGEEVTCVKVARVVARSEMKRVMLPV
jgi:hypothetical protein